MDTAKKVNRRKWQIHARTSNSHIAAAQGNRLAGMRPDLEVRVRYDDETRLCIVEKRAR